MFEFMIWCDFICWTPSNLTIYIYIYIYVYSICIYAYRTEHVSDNTNHKHKPQSSRPDQRPSASAFSPPSL